MTSSHSRLINELSSSTSIISLRYILPEILTDESAANNTIIWKFHTLGHVITIYGSLSNFGSRLHRMCLNKSKFALASDLMPSKYDLKDDSINNVNDNNEK